MNLEGDTSFWNREGKREKMDLGKAEEPGQIANIYRITEKARVSEKHLLLFDYANPWLCVSQQIVENSSRDGNIRPPDLPLKTICMQVKK